MAEDAASESPIYGQGFRWQLPASTDFKQIVELIRDQNITLSAYSNGHGGFVEYKVEQSGGATRFFKMRSPEDTVIACGRAVSARTTGGIGAAGSIFVHPSP